LGWPPSQGGNVANEISAFLQRVTGATGEFNKAKVGTLSALDAVYLDIKPAVAVLGQTIRIYFPDIGPFTDQAANDWTPQDTNPGFIDVPFGQRPGYSIMVRDFEQFQTSTNIIDQFIDPLYKRAEEYGNLQIFNLLNTTNFSLTATPPQQASYPTIVTTPGEIQVGDVKLAWNQLVNNKVPLTGPENATILYHPDVHANTLTDTNWYQENLVGALIAESTRRDVAAPGTGANVAFNFKRRFDQQAPTSQTANLTGTVTVANGSVAVVGSGTSFTTQAPVGSWLTFGTDTVAYYVKTIVDDTHLTLGMLYGGSLTSANTFTRRTYTSIAMHKFAIGLAVRPLEIVNNGQVQSRLIEMRGLPMRLQLSYQHLKGGWFLSLDYAMVAKVIRPDFGVLMAS
jgi:hypothetical protein